jgi:hypothetical protein
MQKLRVYDICRDIRTGKRGRKPIGIETMLRMYFLHIWFNLSDEAGRKMTPLVT